MQRRRCFNGTVRRIFFATLSLSLSEETMDLSKEKLPGLIWPTVAQVLQDLRSMSPIAKLVATSVQSYESRLVWASMVQSRGGVAEVASQDLLQALQASVARGNSVTVERPPIQCRARQTPFDHPSHMPTSLPRAVQLDLLGSSWASNRKLHLAAVAQTAAFNWLQLSTL